jgi:hypothetical protein
MAEVVLFHHVQGLTDGVRAFAQELRAGGHTVHTPDLFDTERPATIDDGIALVQSIGDEELSERVDRARSSRWKGTSTRPASWSRRSGPGWPSCSSIRATGTCSATARCRRTTRTRRRWWCSGRGTSSTGWADGARSLAGRRLGGAQRQVPSPGPGRAAAAARPSVRRSGRAGRPPALSRFPAAR